MWAQLMKMVLIPGHGGELLETVDMLKIKTLQGDFNKGAACIHLTLLIVTHVHCFQALMEHREKQVECRKTVTQLQAKIHLSLASLEEAAVLEEAVAVVEGSPAASPINSHSEEEAKGNSEEEMQDDEDDKDDKEEVHSEMKIEDCGEQLKIQQKQLKIMEKATEELQAQKAEHHKQVKQLSAHFLPCLNTVLCVKAMGTKGRWVSHQVDQLSINIKAGLAAGLADERMPEQLNCLVGAGLEKLDQERSCPKVEFSRIITSEVNSAEMALRLMEQMQQAKTRPAASIECNLQKLDAIM